MEDSKIQLSAEEMQLVENTQWILTKQRILQKVLLLFGALSENLQQEILTSSLDWPETMPAPKISKGEQYQGFPYVILDYPRIFSIADVFAIRCFFWWGHYFSITLHLKGKYAAQYLYNMQQALAAQKLNDFWVSVSGSEFNFDLSQPDYVPAANHPAALAAAPHGHPFIKLSYRLPFSQWNTISRQLLDQFKKIIKMLED